jgi:broad specificity phosphatase PhoE
LNNENDRIGATVTAQHPSPSRLVLVRHGETVGNSKIRYYGRTDLELSTLGRDQMRAARAWLDTHLAPTRLAPVFTSPLRRAAEGASIIAGEEAQKIQIDEFIEVDFGLFEGLTAGEIRQRHPAEFDLWNRDRLAAGYTYPGGENRAAFTARVERGVARMLDLLELATEALGSGALVVAHRGVIRAIVRRLAGPLEPTIDLGSIQLLRRSSKASSGRAGWGVESVDITEHLAGLE